MKVRFESGAMLHSLCGFGEYAKSGICIRNRILANQTKFVPSHGKVIFEEFFAFDLMVLPILGGFLQRRVSISCECRH